MLVLGRGLYLHLVPQHLVVFLLTVAFGLWMAFLVHSGWSDVNVVPLLIAAQTYLL
jgi:hypothetical protein